MLCALNHPMSFGVILLEMETLGWHLYLPKRAWAGFPPGKGAEAPWNRLADACLAVKHQLPLFFCSCQSALMHQHHPLHHTTSLHEQLQGAVTDTGCLPSGLAPA